MAIAILVSFILIVCILGFCQIRRCFLIWDILRGTWDFFKNVFSMTASVSDFKWRGLNHAGGHRNPKTLKSHVSVFCSSPLGWPCPQSERLTPVDEALGAGFSSCFFPAVGWLGSSFWAQDFWGPKARFGGRKPWDLSSRSAEIWSKAWGYLIRHPTNCVFLKYFFSVYLLETQGNDFQ